MFAHIDADAFFASVLQRQHPHLKGKPLLALGMGGGCVIAASYEAKAKGVITGMPLKEARPLCPDAIAIPSDFLDACVVSQQIEAIIRDHCPTIEKTSVDEWYLDLTTITGGVPRDATAWASSIQNTVHARVDVTVSIGIAPTKLLAKMSGEYRKPAGVTIISPSHGEGVRGRGTSVMSNVAHCSIESFLRDRPAAAIPGIGRRRNLHAQSHNWHTAWDIAQAPKETVVHLFGQPGLQMQDELRGIPVFDISEDSAPPKSISRCRSFRKTNDRNAILGFLMQHFAHCMLKMRSHNMACQSVSAWVRDGAYAHEKAVQKLPQPLDTEEQILPYLSACFNRLYDPRCYYTQTGFVLFDFVPRAATQYSLFEETERTNRAEQIQGSLDDIRRRYGRDSIVRGAGLAIEAKKKAATPDVYGNIPFAG